MKRLAHRPGWPLSWLTIAIPSTLIFVVALTLQTDIPVRLSLPYQVWVTTSAQFHEKLLFAGPVSAAAATFYAGRLHVPSRLFGQPWAPRSGNQDFLRHVRTLSLAFSTAYVLGLAPLTFMTVLRSHTGGPQVLTMLAGILGLVALVVVGYCVGVFTRTAWTAPLVLIAAFVVMQAPNFNPRLQFVVPVTHFPPLLGQVESIPAQIYRICFFSAVSCGLGLLTVRALERPRRWAKPSAAATTVIAILAGAIAAPVLLHPRLIVGEADRPQSCSTVEAVTYCVHSGRSSQLPAMQKAAEAVFSITGVPKGIHHVTDAALLVDNNRRVGRDTVAVGLEPDESTADYTAEAVAMRATAACPPPENGAASQRGVIGEELTEAILHKVGLSMDTGPQTSPFDRLSRGQLRNWWAEHTDQIAKCALTNKMLP